MFQDIWTQANHWKPVILAHISLCQFTLEKSLKIQMHYRSNLLFCFLLMCVINQKDIKAAFLVYTWERLFFQMVYHIFSHVDLIQICLLRLLFSVSLELWKYCCFFFFFFLLLLFLFLFLLLLLWTRRKTRRHKHEADVSQTGIRARNRQCDEQTGNLSSVLSAARKKKTTTRRSLTSSVK